jgi:hypothetical protein
MRKIHLGGASEHYACGQPDTVGERLNGRCHSQPKNRATPQREHNSKGLTEELHKPYWISVSAVYSDNLRALAGKKKFRDLSSRANYTERATAACRCS